MRERFRRRVQPQPPEEATPILDELGEIELSEHLRDEFRMFAEMRRERVHRLARLEGLLRLHRDDELSVAAEIAVEPVHPLHLG